MKRHLFLMLTAVASMATVSCDNEDLLGVENHNAYVSNFERMFGAVNPEHDFKTVRTVSIDATFAPSMKSANLSVYDGLPSNGTATSLVGKFEHIDQPSATFKVDVKFSRTNLLAGDKFPISQNKKTGDVTIHMPATSYAIMKLK